MVRLVGARAMKSSSRHGFCRALERLFVAVSKGSSARLRRRRGPARTLVALPGFCCAAAFAIERTRSATHARPSGESDTGRCSVVSRVGSCSSDGPLWVSPTASSKVVRTLRSFSSFTGRRSLPVGVYCALLAHTWLLQILTELRGSRDLRSRVTDPTCGGCRVATM